MKRLTEPTDTKDLGPSKGPTIGHLLNSMPKTGLESVEDRLLAYSVLGFYFDGTDYSNKSAKSVSKLITRMDAAIPVPLAVVAIEDEDNDRYGFEYQGREYWFTSPSVRSMPKTIKDDLPAYYHNLIDRLSDDPELVLNLPYYLFGALGDALGKSLGIA